MVVYFRIDLTIAAAKFSFLYYSAHQIRGSSKIKQKIQILTLQPINNKSDSIVTLWIYQLSCDSWRENLPTKTSSQGIILLLRCYISSKQLLPPLWLEYHLSQRQLLVKISRARNKFLSIEKISFFHQPHKLKSLRRGKDFLQLVMSQLIKYSKAQMPKSALVTHSYNKISLQIIYCYCSKVILTPSS